MGSLRLRPCKEELCSSNKREPGTLVVVELGRVVSRALKQLGGALVFDSNGGILR